MDTTDRFKGFDSERLAEARRVMERFWPTVKRALRSIPFMQEVVAAYYAMLDPKTDMRARLIFLGALAYFVLPFDAVPDFILGLGFIDDVSILMAALTAACSSITDEHLEKARRALSDIEEEENADGEGAKAGEPITIDA